MHAMLARSDANSRLKEIQNMPMDKKAEDIMVPLDKYPCVTHKATIREAVEIMENTSYQVDGYKFQPRAALVFDFRHRLLGIIRRRDLLWGLEPKFMRNKRMEYNKKLFDIDTDLNLLEMTHDKLLKGMKSRAELPVKDIMISIKATVNHDDHIVKVISELVSTNVSIIPVIKDDTVVGVVRTIECLHEMAKLLALLK
jgi:predicted transcriptional regulator